MTIDSSKIDIQTKFRERDKISVSYKTSSNRFIGGREKERREREKERGVKLYNFFSRKMKI